MDVTQTLQDGWQLHQEQRWAEAEQRDRQALAHAPKNASAWCYLGMACHDQQRWHEAISAYRRALQFQPAFPIALNNLGNTLRCCGRIAEAVHCFDEALRMKPGYLTAVRNKATTLFWDGQLELAAEEFRSAASIEPEDAETRKNLGVIALLQGRFSEGWPLYESRLSVAPPLLPVGTRPAWPGDPLGDRNLLLVAEQGLGDTIQFVRYAAVIRELSRQATDRCGRIGLVCPPALRPLLEANRVVDELLNPNDDLSDYHVQATLLSLPGLLGQDERSFPAEVPYISAAADDIARWQSELSAIPAPRIGIAWQGNPKFSGDFARSVPLAEFQPLAELQGIQLISVQQRDGLDQLPAFTRRFPLLTLPDEVDQQAPFMDTAAILTQLDLLVTSDSAIAHLAGALGVTAWLLLQRVPDWRWHLSGTRCSWYPSLRLFRQETMGDWKRVLGDVAAAVQDHFPQTRPRRGYEYQVTHGPETRLRRTRHGLLTTGVRDDRVVDLSLASYGQYGEGELSLIQQLIEPGAAVLESFAGVGAMTLPLSRIAGHPGRVVAIEPRPKLRRLLQAHLTINDVGNVQLVAAVARGNADQEQVTLLSPSQWQELPKMAFWRLVAAGQELALLESFLAHRTDRPILYVANESRETSSALIATLRTAGYSLYWHIPPVFAEDNFYGRRDDVFQGAGQVRMLAVPMSRQQSIQGLAAVESDWWS